jgi:hypothetical protein
MQYGPVDKAFHPQNVRNVRLQYSGEGVTKVPIFVGVWSTSGIVGVGGQLDSRAVRDIAAVCRIVKVLKPSPDESITVLLVRMGISAACFTP